MPASVGVSVHPAVNVGWPQGSPVSPHWRVEVAADHGGKPGEVVASIVTVVNHATLGLTAPGKYWVRVQAAGDSPFTAWREFTA